MKHFVPTMDKERTLIFDESGLEAFGSQLRKIRKEKGLTQKQLAFEAGMSFTQIIRIEKAQINPTLSTVFSIARTLDIPLNVLFNFELPALEKHACRHWLSVR